jgi:hypothetical protein
MKAVIACSGSDMEAIMKSDRSVPSKAAAAKGGKSKGETKSRSRITNRLLAERAPWRTKRGRRIRDLWAGYMAALQPGNVVHEAAALEAAELKVACEDARARLLAGDAEAEEGLTRLQNAARRAVEDISSMRPENLPDAPTELDQYLARKAHDDRKHHDAGGAV